MNENMAIFPRMKRRVDCKEVHRKTSLYFIYDSPSGGSICSYWAALMRYKKVAAETEYYVISFQYAQKRCYLATFFQKHHVGR